jgi:hypothetical protein
MYLHGANRNRHHPKGRFLYRPAWSCEDTNADATTDGAGLFVNPDVPDAVPTGGCVSNGVTV